MSIRRCVLLGFALLLAAAEVARSDDAAPANTAEKPAVTLQQPEEAAKPVPPKKEGELTITEHDAEIGGKTIHYTATAGTLPQLGDDGKKKADVFFIAYTVAPADGEKRPITYCFNGGPGSSSVWLHMGMLGPKKVKVAEEGAFTPPPAEVIANPNSLLDLTDLVFIDPVSTGYSRPAEGEKKEQFHGFKEDLDSVGRFIHLYTTKYGRWGSPKFLCGESYGTLRAAALSGHLQDEYNLQMNGIVLVSTVLDFQTLLFGGRNDSPYVLFLPSYATTAWYHKRLGKDLQEMPVEKVAAQAREFALGPYATALLKGDALPKKERREVAREMAKLTGLDARFIERSNLRVGMSRFAEELLRSKDQILGRFDSRYTARDADASADRPEFDPSASGVFGAFTSAMYQYFREDLKVEKDVPYEILTGNVQPWNYQPFTNRYVDVTATLGEAMAQNPAMHVFVANGYYDLATPFAAAEYTMSHLTPTPPAGALTLKYYEGGHMMYVSEAALKQLRADLLKFYGEALPKK